MAAGRWVGRGEKNLADGAAVAAMRSLISTVSMQGTVVIGEGEKDDAPMLFNGEQVGDGTGPEVDVAVDPIDGTTLCAKGMPGAIAVLAVTDRGGMYDPSAVFYMDKLVAGPEVADVVDIRLPVAENVRRIAKVKREQPEDVTVVMLDRPRHQALAQEVRDAGARIRFISDGDVAGAIAAARETSGIDLLARRRRHPRGHHHRLRHQVHGRRHPGPALAHRRRRAAAGPRRRPRPRPGPHHRRPRDERALVLRRHRHQRRRPAPRGALPRRAGDDELDRHAQPVGHDPPHREPPRPRAHRRAAGGGRTWRERLGSTLPVDRTRRRHRRAPRRHRPHPRRRHRRARRRLPRQRRPRPRPARPRHPPGHPRRHRRARRPLPRARRGRRRRPPPREHERRAPHLHRRRDDRRGRRGVLRLRPPLEPAAGAAPGGDGPRPLRLDRHDPRARRGRGHRRPPPRPPRRHRVLRPERAPHDHGRARGRAPPGRGARRAVRRRQVLRGRHPLALPGRGRLARHGRLGRPRRRPHRRHPRRERRHVAHRRRRGGHRAGARQGRRRHRRGRRLLHGRASSPGCSTSACSAGPTRASGCAPRPSTTSTPRSTAPSRRAGSPSAAPGPTRRPERRSDGRVRLRGPAARRGRRDPVPAADDRGRVRRRRAGRAPLPPGRVRGAAPAHRHRDARHRPLPAPRAPPAAARTSSTTPRRATTTSSSPSTC